MRFELIPDAHSAQLTFLFCLHSPLLGTKWVSRLVRNDPLPQGAYDLVRETEYGTENMVSHKTVIVTKQKLSSVRCRGLKCLNCTLEEGRRLGEGHAGRHGAGSCKGWRTRLSVARFGGCGGSNLTVERIKFGT